MTDKTVLLNFKKRQSESQLTSETQRQLDDLEKDSANGGARTKGSRRTARLITSFERQRLQIARMASEPLWNQPDHSTTRCGPRHPNPG